ncbi:hypothetical protein [Hymenobacter sp.]|uniref:exodeoxyribonuclease X C-terminal domain-containing protein n=1 Tax=Hymenobacter sp. TaxID=1898978 RepID=UPI00286CA3BB|nr:hypothetical protein [Hymenobacter sp.]
MSSTDYPPIIERPQRMKPWPAWLCRAPAAAHPAAPDPGATLLGFGKHRGQTLGQVQAAAPTYLDWLLAQDFTQASLKKAIRALRA